MGPSRIAAALAVSAALFLAAPAQAQPLDKTGLAIEVLGFDRDANLFGYWLTGTYRVGDEEHPVAELHVVSTLSDPRGASIIDQSEAAQKDSDTVSSLRAGIEAARRAELRRMGLGADPGRELYKSGTATTTQLAVPGAGPLALSVSPRLITLVSPDGGVATQDVNASPDATNWTLSMARLSANGRTLAVITKHSLLVGYNQRIERREHVVTFFHLEPPSLAAGVEISKVAFHRSNEAAETEAETTFDPISLDIEVVLRGRPGAPVQGTLVLSGAAEPTPHARFRPFTTTRRFTGKDDVHLDESGTASVRVPQNFGKMNCEHVTVVATFTDASKRTSRNARAFVHSCGD